MTNTKFRKRMLISSVAMLLVALVALGSATFAWFTSNPVASATGITGKGQTSTGLTITTDTDPNPSNTHAATFMKSDAIVANEELTLIPAFMLGKASFLQTTAHDSNDQEADPAAKWATISNVVDASTYDPADAQTKLTLGEGVYSETAYLKTTGQGTTNTDVYLTKLSINTPNNPPAISGAVCVAVYVGTTLKGIYKVDTDEIKTYSTTPANNTTVGAEAAGTTAVLANKTKFVNSSAAVEAIGQANDTTALAVTFVVYLDGTDELVKTDGASASSLVSSIVAEFSTNAPA